MPTMAPVDSAAAVAAAGVGEAWLPNVLVTETAETAKADAAAFDAAARLIKTADSAAVMLAGVAVASAALIDDMAASVAADPSAGGTTRANQVTLEACSARAPAAAARRVSAIVLTVIIDAFTPSAGARAAATLARVPDVTAAAAAAALGTDTVSVRTTRGTGVADAAREGDALAVGEAVADGDAPKVALADGDPERDAAGVAAAGDGLDDGVDVSTAYCARLEPVVLS